MNALPGFSFSIVLLPLASEYCNRVTELNVTCDPRYTYLSNNDSAKPIVNTNILTNLGLSRFLDSEPEASQATWFGSTTIGIGPASKRSITLEQRVIAGTASKTLNLGLFGLSVKALTIPGIVDTTFIQTLADFALIPASGFSYTAGSFGIGATWKSPSSSGYSNQSSTQENSLTTRAIQPSLVLGGYDASRIDQKSILEVNIANNNALSLTVSLYVDLTSITFSGSDETWRNGTVDNLGSTAVYIDSSIAQLWLPLSACRVFERVFGLTWNEDSELYLVNDTEHTRLKQLNTSVTFSLHSARHDSTVRNFTLSYAAFDLLITYPLVPSTGYYFPLKRASSPEQFMLGRAFLQETHISVDYGAATFNISKAVNNNASQERLLSFPTQPNITAHETHNMGITTGAYAGIGVGVAAATVLVGLALLAWRMRWWPLKKRSDESDKLDQNSEENLHGEANPGVEAMGNERMELEAMEAMLEIGAARHRPYEISGRDVLNELNAQSSPREVAGNTFA